MNSRIFTAAGLGMILMAIALAFAGYLVPALITLAAVVLGGVILVIIAYRSGL